MPGLKETMRGIEDILWECFCPILVWNYYYLNFHLISTLYGLQMRKQVVDRWDQKRNWLFQYKDIYHPQCTKHFCVQMLQFNYKSKYILKFNECKFIFIKPLSEAMNFSDVSLSVEEKMRSDHSSRSLFEMVISLYNS